MSSYVFILPWEIHHIGGVNQVVGNLYKALQIQGAYRPILLVGDWHQTRPCIRQDGGISTITLRLRSPWDRKRPIRGLLSFLLSVPKSAYNLNKLLRDNDVDVVNPHYPSLGSCMFALLKRLGLFRGRLVLSFHGLDISRAMNSHRVEQLLWRWLMRSADALVACSNSLAETLSTFAPDCRDRIHVVHNGVDADTLARESKEKNLVRDTVGDFPFILNIGTFEHKKGQDVLVRAFQDVHRRFPSYRLVLIGRSGEVEASVRELIIELGLANNVILVKDLPHENVAAFIANATLFVLSSRKEAFPVAILEVGALGLPVVSTAVDGVPEILVDGVNSYLVQPDDPGSLANAILRMLENPADAERMAAELKDRVTSRYSWTRALTQYIDIVASGA